MGEYGIYKNREIKIGTCEDMYYLRADQIHLVRSSTLDDLAPIRFRFPFPDEDDVEPGEFRDHNRGFKVQLEPPAGADEIHHKIQFAAQAGILVMLPCPYSEAGKTSGIKYGFNGYRGPTRIYQQRAWAGVWATVMACVCEGLYRLPTLDDALPVIEALLKEGDERERWHEGDGKIYHEMALRVRQGYETPVPATTR